MAERPPSGQRPAAGRLRLPRCLPILAAQRQATDGDTRLRADTEFARWRSGVAQVVGTMLSSGPLTPSGLDFVQGMARTLNAWQEEPVPAAGQAAADRQAAAHLTRWRLDHG